MTSDPTIGILRMPMGNLRSAFNAVHENGFDPVFVDGDGEDFNDLTHLIVPGVGNFTAVMGHLKAKGVADRIRDFATSGRPVLGICAGMQLLAERGVEGGDTAGLGLVHGRVERLPEQGQVLPHVGWSTVRFRFPHPVLEDVKHGRDFYFVHSFGLFTDHDEEFLGETEYGVPFASIVVRDNVIGFQFHPEKSQANGLKLIENFCQWDGKC